MSRPKPPSPDCLKDIRDRIELLLNKGMLGKDLPLSTEEASAITGLSQATVRRYGIAGHFPTFKVPGRNFYPCRELCDWTLKHYYGITGITTSQMNKYQPSVARRGRPKKKLTKSGADTT